MEKENLHILSLFMDSPIVIVPEDKVDFSESIKTKEENEMEILPEEVESPMNYVGKFEKKILIAFEGDELSAEAHEFLFKLISAVNCNINDVAIFSSIEFEKCSKSQILEMDTQKYLVFGKVSHEIFNFRRNNYEMIHQDEVEFLFCDDILSIMDNVNLKKALWGKLKQLFNLN
jgi:hypothetical protein